MSAETITETIAVITRERRVDARVLLGILASCEQAGVNLAALVVAVEQRADPFPGQGATDLRVSGPPDDVRRFVAGCTRQAIDDGDTFLQEAPVSRVRLTTYDRCEVSIAPGVGRRSLTIPLDPLPLETVAIEVSGGLSGAAVAVAGRVVDVDGRARSEWFPFPLHGGALSGRVPLPSIPSTGNMIALVIDGVNAEPLRGWVRVDAIRMPPSRVRDERSDHLDELIRRIESATTTHVDAADVRELAAVAVKVAELSRVLSRFL